MNKYLISLCLFIYFFFCFRDVFKVYFYVDHSSVSDEHAYNVTFKYNLPPTVEFVAVDTGYTETKGVGQTAFLVCVAYLPEIELLLLICVHSTTNLSFATPVIVSRVLKPVYIAIIEQACT